ncbi:MAG: DUF255 domain-containing protein [candidate division NC10 bacterium]|nr:DUF255 domain-containing protein [candidate division NC10 bacterium]MDE2322636.1 DUF255 domain-containing protein [candidate division NC10 bacterium]
MSKEAPARHTNRLICETSPYLLQHAHNPVDWYPWGEDALRRAREENRPILLSIGYSSCHWCHVMAHESFEDEAIAELMNQHFVCIKVDREERPDLDAIYMAATMALNQGQGGWPMTVFLTPDLQPFFAGTYFPPRNGLGRTGFPTILKRIAQVWREQPDALRTQSAEITEHLRGTQRQPGPLPVGWAEIAAAVAHFASTFDPTFGGFGAAPKFPAAAALSLLLRHHRRTGDAHALQMVRTTLDAMALGGIYDHIGGGFARYSTDERWLVPHFEKMLYDNALLTRTYLEAFQVTGDPFYQRIASEVLDYILREMTAPEGGFYSATDADSEGVEGKFYVWTPAEIDTILGEEEARRFCAYYDISESGNWESKSIPNIRRTAVQVAAKLGVTVEELQVSVDRARPKVYEARRRRVPPGLDDKILTAWNGMMISAMAEGYRVLGEKRYLDAAVCAADFLLRTLVQPDGRLLRTYRNGSAHLNAYLEDYAYLCEGLIDLYETGGEARYLREAVRLAERLLADFVDEESGAFCTTSRDHEWLILRHREGTDGATPSGNAVAAAALARLSFHLDREELRRAAEQAISAHGKRIALYPHAFAKSLAVTDFLLEGPVELALIGSPGEAGYEALRREVGRHYLPNRIMAHHDPTESEPLDFPLVKGKGLADGQAALYICRNFTCQALITDPARAAEALSMSERPSAGDTHSVVGSFLAGHATEAGTAAYAARFASSGYTALGLTGLITSKLGFGGYRIDDDTREHYEALKKALLEGCNLIDTSTNYMDGGSERCVGAVLGELARAGKLRREEVVVVSKIGYVQGENLELAQQREAAGAPFPEMVKYMDGCWHCIHPEFLRDQLERSLTRLQLDTLDVCLLHNPEYFLTDTKHRGHGDLESARDEFYRRLREAFAFLETQAAAGTIRWYGVSSNTAVSPAVDPEATSLTRMLAAAREAGGPDHRFRILQLPINLFEAGALLTRNNGPDNKQTVLETASAAGTGVLVNRPLNAIVGNRMVRLAATPSRRVADAISAAIDPLLPEAGRGESLSRKALWILTSTPGVSCVLNGMRTPAYVDDSLGVLSWPPLADVVPIYQAVARLKSLDVDRLSR